MYTYPAPPVTVTQGGSATEVHHFMKTPSLIARRVATLADFSFISDFLLTGRYIAKGGAILYETGEEIFAADAPEAIAPGGEYPLTSMTGGELAAAKTVKWGRDSKVTDEAITRLLMNPVERAMRKQVNNMVRQVDGVALGVIASKVTQTFDTAATGSWTTAKGIIHGALGAKAKLEEDMEEEGYDLNVIVLPPTQYAAVMAEFISSGLLPRESGNPLTGRAFPDILGLTWTTSNHMPFTDPILVDNERLGGMADEKIASPGYVQSPGTSAGVEVKSIRDEDTDSYKVRARRVTVPVVIEPHAAVRLEGTR